MHGNAGVNSKMENKILTKKALETRQKLMTATLEQVAERGYHNITADDIAKACGMSTGSAYRYFKNKREMLLAAIEYCYANIQSFSGTEDTRLAEFDTVEEMLEYALGQFYLIHKKYYALHEELESLRHIDADIRAVYEKIMQDAVEVLLSKCSAKLGPLPNLRERLYAAIGILENCVHIQMNDGISKALDMDELQKISIKAVMAILNG